MFRNIDDFAAAWAYEHEITSKLFSGLTDESLGQRVTPDGRTLGFIAWHIVITLGEMLSKVGLGVDAPAEDAEVPASAAEIAAAFDKGARSVGEQVAANWTDDSLLQEDEMYGMKWKRGMTLTALINHQCHHRGQMTVLMRQAGVPVIGVYGPAREEWSEMGMDAMP